MKCVALMTGTQRDISRMNIPALSRIERHATMESGNRAAVSFSSHAKSN
jgi:hypothetical protein